MKLKIFDKDMGYISKKDAAPVLKYIEEIAENLDFIIYEITEIDIARFTISITFNGNFATTYDISKSIEWTFFYDIAYNELDSFDNIFHPDDAPDIDWDIIQNFHENHTHIQNKFIQAIDKGDFETMKKLNKEYPELAYPSISNSSYARWLIKIGKIEVLEWAKSIDANIDFSDNPRLENPLKIAINENYEDIAIWLIDNYQISLSEKSDTEYLIKKANQNSMFNLVSKMQENQDFIKKLISEDKLDFVPKSVKDIFLF